MIKSIKFDSVDKVDSVQSVEKRILLFNGISPSKFRQIQLKKRSCCYKRYHSKCHKGERRIAKSSFYLSVSSFQYLLLLVESILRQLIAFTFDCTRDRSILVKGRPVIQPFNRILLRELMYELCSAPHFYDRIAKTAGSYAKSRIFPVHR